MTLMDKEGASMPLFCQLPTGLKWVRLLGLFFEHLAFPTLVVSHSRTG